MISDRHFDGVRQFLEENFILEIRDDESSEIQFKMILESMRHPPKSRGEMSACLSLDTGWAADIAVVPGDIEKFISEKEGTLNFQDMLQHHIAEQHLDNASVYTKALLDRKFFSKIISKKDYVPKKPTVMALGLALELPLTQFEAFLESAGYAFMPSSRFDLIVKYCVMNGIFSISDVDELLDRCGETCFAPR